MSVFRSSIIYSFFTSISRIFGFLRDILIANFLGTGFLADIFFVAFRFPNTFRRIFSEGALNSAFVPIYTKLLDDNSNKISSKFSGSILLIFFLITSLIVILIEIFMPAFIALIAPGYVSNEVKFNQLVNVARIIFPFLILISISSICSSILNSNNKFALSASLPIILNITLIISLIIAHFTMNNYLIFLSWSVIVAGILQVFFLYIALNKLGIKTVFTLDIFNNYTTRFFRLFTTSFFASGLLQINILIGTIIASYESGAVSYLYYADRVYQLPLALIGIAIGIALLPSISSKIKSEKNKKINQSIQETIIIALLFSVPASVGIFSMSEPIISALFERGEFNQDSSFYTAEALKYYSFGLVAFILLKIYTPIFFAYENAKPTLYVTVINLFFNTTLSIILFIYMGFVGIAIATSISAWISVIIMNYYLHKNNYFKVQKKIILPITMIIFTSFLIHNYLIFIKKNYLLISEFMKGNDIIFLLFSVLSSILLYLILISIYKPFRYSQLKKLLQK